MDIITNEELARLYNLACMATYSPWDLADFDRESIDMAHKLHAVIHAQRTALIAWQFQAAGAVLQLQRLMDAAQAMREAQQAWGKLIGVDTDMRITPEINQAACILGDAEDELDGLLAKYRKALNFVK